MENMSTATLEATPATLGAINARPQESAIPRPHRTSGIICTVAGYYLFLQGLWLLFSGNSFGSGSLSGQIDVALAGVLWLSIPSLLYFGRKSRLAGH